jgi:signal transduction histidine kinase
MKESNTVIKNQEERLSDFVEAAAHDLHAPLRKLSVLVERIFIKNMNQFDEHAREYITRIETCLEEMRSLINGLTDLAKADVQTSIIDTCDLNQVAKQTLETMSEEIEEKQVQVHISSLPVVQGNIVQYKQLLKNLFENAIKFSNKDIPVKIDIKPGSITDKEKTEHNLSPHKKYFKIEISDNGIGFNQVYAKKIFEPFVRLHSKSRYEGNGLGLSVSKKIVTNHQGVIYAEGNEKEGSRFVLILPETPDHTC